MTATTSIRTAAKTALVSALNAKAALSGVQVDPGWPGRNMQREHVWIANITGQVDYPTIKAGRKWRDDTFTLTVVFRAEGQGLTPAEADARVEDMYAALEDVLADDLTLSALDGVLSVTLGPTVEGPDSELTDEGALAVISAEVTVHARLK